MPGLQGRRGICEVSVIPMPSSKTDLERTWVGFANSNSLFGASDNQSQMNFLL
jgi:hypothetical protein